MGCPGEAAEEHKSWHDWGATGRGSPVAAPMPPVRYGLYENVICVRLMQVRAGLLAAQAGIATCARKTIYA